MVNVNVIVIKTFISEKNSFQKYDKTDYKYFTIQAMSLEIMVCKSITKCY